MRALRGGGSSDWADRWLGPEGFRYRLQRYAVFSALLLLVLVGYISSLLQQHQGPLPLPDVGPAEGTGGGVSSAVVEDGSDTELLPDLVDGSHLRRPNQILHPLSVLKPDALANEDIPSKTSTSGVGGSASDGGGGGGSASGGGGGGGGDRGAQCNVWEGEWVEDAMYPLYTSRCRHIVSDPTYNCQKNGRNSTEYSHYRWQPEGCSVERFNTPVFLMPLQHRRVVFVGDYAAKQMFMSLLCLLSTPDIETINLPIAPTASPSARPEARRRLRERGRGRRRRGTNSGGDNGAGSSSISREKAHVKMTAGHGLDGLLARGRRGRRGRRRRNTVGDNSSSTSGSGAGDVSNTGSTTSRSSSSRVDSKQIQLLRSVMQPNDVTFDFLSSPFLAPSVDLSVSPLSSISNAHGDEAEPSARTAVDVTDLDFGVKAVIRQADVVVVSAGAHFERYTGRPTFVQRQENGTLEEIAWPKALASVLSKLVLELKAVRDAPADDAVEESAADSSRRGKQQLAFFIGVPTSHYGTEEGAFLDLSQPLTGSETCPSESRLQGAGETKPRPPRAQASVREALADTDTIELLKITPMTATRGDAHVGKHWPEGVIGKAESDCTHFCLPGVPDTWNELMLHRLLTRGWDADPWNVSQN